MPFRGDSDDTKEHIENRIKKAKEDQEIIKRHSKFYKGIIKVANYNNKMIPPVDWFAAATPSSSPTTSQFNVIHNYQAADSEYVPRVVYSRKAFIK